jgi:hypothetical protein
MLLAELAQRGPMELAGDRLVAPVLVSPRIVVAFDAELSPLRWCPSAVHNPLSLPDA